MTKSRLQKFPLLVPSRKDLYGKINGMTFDEAHFTGPSVISTSNSQEQLIGKKAKMTGLFYRIMLLTC